MRDKMLAELIGIAFILFFLANFFGPISNMVTGVTIQHNGYTANPNLTSTVSIGTKTNPQAVTVSPGLAPLFQVLPVVFVIVIVFSALALLERAMGHPTGFIANKTTGISIAKIEPFKPDIPAWNRVNCGGSNPRGTELCEYCGHAKGFWEQR